MFIRVSRSIYNPQLFHDSQMFTLEMERLHLRFLPDS